MVVLLCLAFALYLGYRYKLDWVGVASASNNDVKSLWDWMELLLFPAALAIGIWWLSSTEQRRQQNRIEAQKQIEIQAVIEKQRQEAVQDYIDHMTRFILEENLIAADEESALLAIATAKTLATLRMLDPVRKAIVIRFLYDTQLISAGYDDEPRSHPLLLIDGADLSGLRLTDSSLYRIVLREADLRDAVLHRSVFTEGDFFGSNATNAEFTGGELISANFVRSNLAFAKLNAVNASEINLALANAEGADFCGSILYKANFDRCILREAHFARCDLGGACFKGADLNQAILKDADMSPFAGEKITSFVGADLTDADLTNADLSYVDFTDAKVIKEQLNLAKSIEGAKLPNSL